MRADLGDAAVTPEARALETARRERENNRQLYAAAIEERDYWKERCHALEYSVAEIDVGHRTTRRLPRLSVKESVVFRLIGLYIFLFPRSGAEFLADVHLRTAERIKQIKKAEKETSLAA